MILSARDFRVDDRVIGESDGETLMGVVVETLPHHLEADDVCVRWNDEAYESDSDSNIVPASLLRLWPHRAHVDRVLASRKPS